MAHRPFCRKPEAEASLRMKVFRLSFMHGAGGRYFSCRMQSKQRLEKEALAVMIFSVLADIYILGSNNRKILIQSKEKGGRSA
ncbi:hypothetical protein J6TS7_08830 [Paenibacillus dendritiformis]|nr:hypothetical protein J6TS7_08830 [Paenibacillus dendritiformis]